MTIDDDRRSPRVAPGAVPASRVHTTLAPCRLRTTGPRALAFATVLLATGAGASLAKPGDPGSDTPSASGPPAKAARIAMVATPKPKADAARPRRSARETLISLAEDTARRHGIDRLLVHAVILAESAYNPAALSHKGAMGLMQLIPGTARRYGVSDPWDPAQNLDGGVRYMRDLLRRFEQAELALAAYNAGESAVERYGNSVPPYRETETYVARTAAYLARLKAGASVGELIAKGVAVGTQLSGWGLMFGFFPERKEALSLVREQRARLKGVLDRGRPLVVRRELANGPRYGALLVGLAEGDAGPACKHLWTQSVYCLALAPWELTDPNAIWQR